MALLAIVTMVATAPVLAPMLVRLVRQNRMRRDISPGECAQRLEAVNKRIDILKSELDAHVATTTREFSAVRQGESRIEAKLDTLIERGSPAVDRLALALARLEQRFDDHNGALLRLDERFSDHDENERGKVWPLLEGISRDLASINSRRRPDRRGE